jgi:UDP-N-acetylglucosamine 2-epimerase (non-hydrolysing)/GDP/UDP-N,N'-diacetylbacillosamine 2-epimerase (hydrolysing)
LYKQAKFLIGNSSSGILEAASIPLGVINVGLRQRGRYCGDNVIFSENRKDDIEKSIEKILSRVFQNNISTITNPYGDGKSCNKVYELIRTTDTSKLIKKTEDPLEMN